MERSLLIHEGIWYNVSDHIRWQTKGGGVCELGNGNMIANACRFGDTIYFNMSLYWEDKTKVADNQAFQFFFEHPELQHNYWGWFYKIRPALNFHMYRSGSNGGRIIGEALFTQPGTSPKHFCLQLYVSQPNSVYSARVGQTWPVQWRGGMHMHVTGFWEGPSA